MCRNVDHGGRRCPNDNSAARRIRRVNAGLKSSFSGEVHEPLHSSSVNQENLVPQAVEATVTLADIKQALDYHKSLQALLWDADGKPHPIPDEMGLTFEGVTYSDKMSMHNAIKSRLEQETIRVGSIIALAASQKTGFTDEMIIESNRKEVEEAEEAWKKAQKDYDEYANAMHVKYNTMVMDITYNINNKREFIERKIAEAAAAGEEYIPEFDPAEIQADYEEGRRLIKAKDDAYTNVRETKSKGTEDARAKMEANREVQLQLLKEVRDFGGEAIVHEKSNKPKVNVLNRALSFVPTDWVEKSNLTGSELMVKSTKARAHYSDGSYQKEYKVVKSGRIRVLKDGAEPDNSYHQSGWIKVTADEDGRVEYVDEGGVTHERWIEPNETAYYAPDWEYSRNYYDRDRSADPNKKPYGRGWEYVIINDTEYNYETKEHTPIERGAWRRRVTKRNLISLSKTAELLIDGNGKGNSGVDTAVHEFMHRVEAKDPRIGFLEAEFIRRRTTKEDGTREGMIRIYARKNEFGQPDNFIDNYMGKHYDHSDGKHWEVLSTGAEALWTGAFGGFMGVGNYKADTDHRNFILGIMAGI